MGMGLLGGAEVNGAVLGRAHVSSDNLLTTERQFRDTRVKSRWD